MKTKNALFLIGVVAMALKERDKQSIVHIEANLCKNVT